MAREPSESNGQSAVQTKKRQQQRAFLFILALESRRLHLLASEKNQNLNGLLSTLGCMRLAVRLCCGYSSMHGRWRPW